MFLNELHGRIGVDVRDSGSIRTIVIPAANHT
jgi:hypothetical protein